MLWLPIQILSIAIIAVLRSGLGRWGRRFPLLLLVNGDVGVDLPQATFSYLASLLEGFAADEIVPDTTLPSGGAGSVLEERIHLLHGIVDLLQVHDASGRLGEGLVDTDDVGLGWLLELVLGVFGLWLLRRGGADNPFGFVIFPIRRSLAGCLRRG